MIRVGHVVQALQRHPVHDVVAGDMPHALKGAAELLEEPLLLG